MFMLLGTLHGMLLDVPAGGKSQEGSGDCQVHEIRPLP